ncbi:GntR family transcriptional regulator [Pseudaminobacter sp. NGMCC 1.201702]|uniref:GntR family transcriptional regulator n=1 Tax=Pseudaminobacter sp. NGMCC 1.201702 TaxID=3391825 RepID=UPI0039F12B0D
MLEARNNAQHVYDALTSAIVEQALAPETKLPEELICKQFGVSRHIVRSAFQMLAADGLVDIRQNRGATVAKPSFEHGMDVLRIRMELEDVVVRYLAGNLNKAQAAQLRESINKEHEYIHIDHALYMRHAYGFHRSLARMTESKILIRYLDPLLSQSSLVLYLYGRPRWTKCNADEHLEIVSALEAGQEAKACKLMRNHLEAMFQRAFSDTAKDETTSLIDVLERYAKVS